MKSVYLDYNASTPIRQEVLEAMLPHMKQPANPSSLHSPGRDRRRVLEKSRSTIARVLGAKAAEIVFTSGSTEAANLVIQGVLGAHPRGRIVATALDHQAVLQPIEQVARRGSLTGVILVGESGIVAVEQVRAVIDDTTVLVCVQYVNNEIGTIQPVAKVGQLIKEIRADRSSRGIQNPIYLYCDAAQAGLMNLQVSRLGVDMMSMAGSKIYGPAGNGFLYIRGGAELKPVSFGGGQEMGLRPGTEDVAGAVGLAEALELIQEDKDRESKRLLELRDWLWSQIAKKVSGAGLNGDAKRRSGNNLNFVVEGASGETMVAYLDKAGYAVATGSACTAANQAPSHVLLAIGRSREQAESSLRISLGAQTTKSDLTGFVSALEECAEKARKLA